MEYEARSRSRQVRPVWMHVSQLRLQAVKGDQVTNPVPPKGFGLTFCGRCKGWIYVRLSDGAAMPCPRCD